jgi:hypothetical protein
MKPVPLPPTTIGAIIAGVLSLAVVGYIGMLFLGTAADPVADASHKYDTQVLATELNSQNDKSVFLRTVQLGTKTAQTSGVVTYTTDEIGKSDITQAGK